MIDRFQPPTRTNTEGYHNVCTSEHRMFFPKVGGKETELMHQERMCPSKYGFYQVREEKSQPSIRKMNLQLKKITRGSRRNEHNIPVHVRPFNMLVQLKDKTQKQNSTICGWMQPASSTPLWPCFWSRSPTDLLLLLGRCEAMGWRSAGPQLEKGGLPTGLESSYRKGWKSSRKWRLSEAVAVVTTPPGRLPGEKGPGQVCEELVEVVVERVPGPPCWGYDPCDPNLDKGLEDEDDVWWGDGSSQGDHFTKK